MIFFQPTLLLKNLDISNGLCNEIRLVCRSFNKNIIHAEIAMGDSAEIAMGDSAEKTSFSSTNTIKPTKWQWIFIHAQEKTITPSFMLCNDN